MADKSGADYGKKVFSYEDAKKYVEDAEEFVAAVKNWLHWKMRGVSFNDGAM